MILRKKYFAVHDVITGKWLDHRDEWTSRLEDARLRESPFPLARLKTWAKKWCPNQLISVVIISVKPVVESSWDLEDLTQADLDKQCLRTNTTT